MSSLTPLEAATNDQNLDEWTNDEILFLLYGVSTHGLYSWQGILRTYKSRFNNRSAADLAQKYSDLKTDSMVAIYERLVRIYNKFISGMFARRQCFNQVYVKLMSLERNDPCAN